MNTNAFDLLKRAHKNHSSVARKLKISPRHYRNIRNGLAVASDPLILLIDKMAKEAVAIIEERANGAPPTAEKI